MEKHSVSKATLGRLPCYLEILKGISPEEVPYISATAIAKKLSLGEVQVRKDLAAVSGAENLSLAMLQQSLSKKLKLVLVMIS